MRKSNNLITVKENVKLPDSNIVLEKGDKIKVVSKVKIKEAGQYTFDGDVVDSFYDEDKTYKTIFNRFNKIIAEAKKAGIKVLDAKKFAEELYDELVSSKGGVPESENIVKYIESWLDEDEQRETITSEIAGKIIDFIDEKATQATEYYYSEDYWGDNSYIAYESLDLNKVPAEVRKFIKKAGITLPDFEKFLAENQFEAKIHISRNYSRGIDSEDYIVLWASEIGEQTDQLELDDLAKALPEDLKEYVERNVGATLSKEWDYITVYDSGAAVTYYLDWKDIKDEAEEYFGVSE